MKYSYVQTCSKDEGKQKVLLLYSSLINLKSKLLHFSN